MPMGLAVEMVVGTGIIYGSVCGLILYRPSPVWIALFVLFLAVGTGVGIWAGFYCSYFPHPEVQVFSFPVPAGCLVLERPEGLEPRWTDFITPAPLLVAVTNAAFIASLTTLPLLAVRGLIEAFRGNRDTTESTA